MANLVTYTIAVPATAGAVGAAVDVRTAYRNLVFEIGGAGEGDQVVIEGSADGNAPWGDLCTCDNNDLSVPSQETVVGFVRARRARVDPTGSPTCEASAEPYPGGASMTFRTLAVPSVDGVGAATAVDDLGIKGILISTFDVNDILTLEASPDASGPWLPVSRLAAGVVIGFPIPVGQVRVRRTRNASSQSRSAPDVGVVCQLMGQLGTIGGGGLTTLQGAYSNGAAGTQVITLAGGVQTDIELERANLGATQVLGLGLDNPTASDAVATEQWSPVFWMAGSSWDANDLVSRRQQVGLQCRGITSNLTAVELRFLLATAGGALTQLAGLDFNSSPNFLRFIGYHSDFQLINTNAHGLYAHNTGTILQVGGAQVFAVAASSVSPGIADVDNGLTGARWRSTWSKRWYTTRQAVSMSATPAFDPANGSLIWFATVNANITGPTIAAGQEGEILTIVMEKDGTGGAYTVPASAGWGANVRCQAATFNAGAGSLVVYEFQYLNLGPGPFWVQKSLSIYA